MGTYYEFEVTVYSDEEGLLALRKAFEDAWLHVDSSWRDEGGDQIYLEGHAKYRIEKEPEDIIAETIWLTLKKKVKFDITIRWIEQTPQDSYDDSDFNFEQIMEEA